MCKQESSDNEWEHKHEEAYGCKAAAVRWLKQALSMLHNRALAVTLRPKVYPAQHCQVVTSNQICHKPWKRAEKAASTHLLQVVPSRGNMHMQVAGSASHSSKT